MNLFQRRTKKTSIFCFSELFFYPFLIRIWFLLRIVLFNFLNLQTFRYLKDAEKKADELYRTAMKFLDKNRVSSFEAKKAAYGLLEEAARLKHRDSMKLIGA